jgi:hypothetical protein
MNVALGIWLIHMLSPGSDWEAPTFPRPELTVSQDEVDGSMEDSDDDDSDCSDDDYEP